MSIQFALVIISCLLLIMLGLLIWVIWLAGQKRVITNTPTTFNQVNNQPPPKMRLPKYANSNLMESQKMDYLNHLIEELETKKLYCRTDLSIAQLAKAINIPKHHLSQVINEKKQCSYLDFINRYRIKEAMDKLQDSTLSEVSILTIGKQVGFNSKSTFYTAFKKYTDSTPGDYRRAVLKKSNSEGI